MKKDASAIGFIGIPDEESIKMLEKELRKPIKKIEKKRKDYFVDWQRIV
jgi:hypothetical protein